GSRVEPFLAQALSGNCCPFSRRLRPFARPGCYLYCLFSLLVPIVQRMLFHLGRELVEPARRSLVCVDGQPFGLDRTGKGPVRREFCRGRPPRQQWTTSKVENVCALIGRSRRPAA